MLLSQYTEKLVEAGCDEAGRGCLAGPVFAAAVILPKHFSHEILNDSKKLTARQRTHLRSMIQEEAVAWAVASVSAAIIDEINILKASFLAMHKAIGELSTSPQLLLIDGNRFSPYKKIPHICIIKGDGLYLSIAAASVLAKSYRDEYMELLHNDFPHYDWEHNKGYPSRKHRDAITLHGITPHHRKTYRLTEQLKFPF
ncbi:MAG: ribonuclease HII [bacterium]